MRNRALAPAAVLLLGSILMACSSSGGASTSPSQATKAIKMAVSLPDLRQDYHLKTKTILEGLAKDLGWTVVVTGADADSSKQLTDAETLLEAKPDILFFQGIDLATAQPIVDAANKAGIPVVNMFSHGNGTLTGVAATMVEDPIGEGTAECQIVVDKLAGKTGQTAAIILGQPGEFANNRGKGCEDVLTAAGITVVAKQNGDWTRPTALTVGENILTAHPNINVLAGGNDDSSLGGLEAVKNRGIDPKTLAIVGIDGTADAIVAVCNGEMLGDVGTLYTDKAQMMVDITKRILIGGEKTITERLAQDKVKITSANVREVGKLIGATLPDTCVQ